MLKANLKNICETLVQAILSVRQGDFFGKFTAHKFVLWVSTFLSKLSPPSNHPSLIFILY